MIEIAHGDYRLCVRPELGAAVTLFTWRGHDVLRPAVADTTDPFKTSCFALAPYANRIAKGRFRFGDRDVQLKVPSDQVHALHGHAWRRPWREDSVSAHSARLSFTYAAADWPWSYRCTQDFVLSDNGAMLTLAIQNTSDTPMPTSLGQHPYYARNRTTRIKADVAGMWRIDETVMPTAYGPNTLLPDLGRGAALGDAPFIDHCFPGWGRTLDVQHQNFGVRMTGSPENNFLHLYVPVGEDHFCGEPVSAMPDAVNRPHVADNGLRVLAPGETLSVWMRLEASEAWSVGPDRA